MAGVVTDFELQVRRTPLPLLTIRQEVGALLMGLSAWEACICWCVLGTAALPELEFSLAICCSTSDRSCP
jgi:hypothetical protein